MLNARGGLGGRVNHPKHNFLIPPPPSKSKAKKPVSCWVPFIWSNCVSFLLGTFILLAGCAMSAVGFYSTQLSTTFNVTYTVIGNVTTETSYPIKQDTELYTHLKHMLIIGPVVMGVGLTIVVVACTVLFEEREKRLKARPIEKDNDETKQKKGKYDLIVAKFKEEQSHAHSNEAFEGDEATEAKLGDQRRSSVYSMDTAMKFASNLLIGPLGLETPEKKSLPKIKTSIPCLDNLRSPSPETPTDNGWLKKSPISDKRPNNRLMPLPAIAPLYGDERDNTSLRDASYNSSLGSLSSAVNSTQNTPSKTKKKKSSKSRESSLASIPKEALAGEVTHLEENGRVVMTTDFEVKVTAPEPETDDAANTNGVLQNNDNVKHLHPEVLIIDETKPSPDYDSSDQGSGIIETKWNGTLTTGHR